MAAPTVLWLLPHTSLQSTGVPWAAHLLPSPACSAGQLGSPACTLCNALVSCMRSPGPPHWQSPQHGGWHSNGSVLRCGSPAHCSFYLWTQPIVPLSQVSLPQWYSWGVTAELGSGHCWTCSFPPVSILQSCQPLPDSTLWGSPSHGERRTNTIAQLCHELEHKYEHLKAPHCVSRSYDTDFLSLAAHWAQQLGF